MMQLFILLQAQSPAHATYGSAASMWIMLILIFVFMWLFMVRPKRKQERASVKDKEFLEQMIKTESTKTSSQRTVIDKLHELKQLLDEGTITQEEFDKAKAKLIDEL